MKITQGSLTGKDARIVKDVFKGYTLRVGGNTYKLNGDLNQVRLLSKEESRSAGKLFLILLLGVTIVGLVIAIPMMIAHRKVLATVVIRLNDGTAFVAQADRKEWGLLSKYQTVDLPDGFNLS